MRARLLVPGLAVFVLAGCGAEKTVSPRPQKVVGTIPTNAEQTTATQTNANVGAGTPAGGQAAAPGTSGGKALFVSNGCNSCHTYKPAGANATIGPDLDKLAAYAKQAKRPLDAFVRESIVDPKAYVQPGYQPVMPSFASLSKAQVDSLVSFLTKGS